MAAVNFAAIQPALGTFVEPKVVSQINRAIVLPQVLKTVKGQNHNVAFTARFGTAKGTKIADGADVVTFNNDAKVPARLEYGIYHDAFSISGKAIAAAAAANNPEQLGQLFMDEMRDSIERLSDGVTEAFYIGAGGADEILGLHDATVPAIGDTGTYANVSSSTYAQWKSSVEDALGGAMSAQLLRNLRRKIYIASGKKPDVFITDPTQFERLAQALGESRQLNQDVYRNDGTKIVLAGGFQTLRFDGIMVIEDRQHPAQIMTALNSSYADIPYLPQPPSEITRSMGERALRGTDEEQFGETEVGMQARIQPLAISGDAYKFALYVYPCLRVSRRNAHGKIINLSA